MLSVKEINLLQAQNEGLKKQNAELQKENSKLKEEIKEYKKHSKCAWKCFEGTLCEEGEKYKTCLQEIKGIATECTTCGDCSNCKYDENCDTDLEEQALGVCKMILEKITKAEEE